jgi:hypothetical protein
MTYLDYARLAAIDGESFRARRPYPWINPEGLLTVEGHERLLATLPDVALFSPFFGVRRAHRQEPHDRFALEYRDDLDIGEPWHALVAELRGEAYRAFLRRLFGRGGLQLTFHWHYTPRGCSVSPHCDAKRKLGSHIFYLNSAADWDPTWGGETLILDDEGRFSRRSAPRFEDFAGVIASKGLGNTSLLFARRKRSWHGVREVSCPEGAFRKVFIVVIGDWARSVSYAWLGRLRGRTFGGY